MAEPTTIVVLHGDQTGEELLHDALRFLDPKLIGVELQLRDYDLSLANRRQTHNEVVLEAADALAAAGYGIKGATVTPPTTGDVGSPNAILRARIGGQVIVRTGRRIPSVRPMAAVYSPISVIPPAAPAGWSPSTRSSRPRGWGPRSSAVPSTPSARSMRGCSKRSSTRPRPAIRTSRTTRS